MVRPGGLMSLLAATANLFTRIHAGFVPAGRIPGHYIVELADDAASEIFGSGDLLGGLSQDLLSGSSLQDTIQHVLNLGPDLVAAGLRVTSPINYKLFKGFTVAFDKNNNNGDTQDAASQLAGHPSIKNLWPTSLLRLEGAVARGSGPAVSEEKKKNKNKKRGFSSSFDYEATFAPHIMGQVDKLHADGIFGNGTKVAFLDTGIDYTLEAFGDCFGVGCLVSSGYDFVGDHYDGHDPSTAVEDDDPMDTCIGHGTHCAGILAAQSTNAFGILGVAPGVTIGMYKIVGCNGFTGEDMLIKGILRAFQDGSDILSISIGGAGGFGEGGWQEVVARCIAAGMVVVQSAGNSGWHGFFYPSAVTGQQQDAIAIVGSVDNEYRPSIFLNTTYTVDNGEPEEFHWLNGWPGSGSGSAWAGVDLPVWALGYNVSDDANSGCTPFPDNTPDLSGYIVMLYYSWECAVNVWDAANHAADHGAKYLVFWSDDWYGISNPDLTGKAPRILASAGIGVHPAVDILDALAAGKTVTLQMADPDTLDTYLTYTRNTILGGYPSIFSSIGPTYDLRILPQFSAPGGPILSTLPAPLGEFGVWVGTSMSTPYVAGVYALIGQVRGSLDPRTLHSLVASTAKAHELGFGLTLEDPRIYPWLTPPVIQGNGMVQAYDAAHATTLLSKSSIHFNDTDHLEPTANFTIHNLSSDKDVTFELGHVGAATGYTFSLRDARPDELLWTKFTDEFATIEFSQTCVTVPAGGEVLVTVTVTPPAVDPVYLPVYSGYITLNGTNGENLSLSYVGVVGSMNKIQTIEGAWLSNSTDSIFWRPVPGDDEQQLPSYSLPTPGNNSADTSNVTYPVAYIDLAFGTPLLDIQLVEWTQGLRWGSINQLPIPDVPRTWLQGEDQLVIPIPFDGTLANGSVVPAGQYIFEFSCAHIFSDPADEFHYERRRSRPFSINYY